MYVPRDMMNSPKVKSLKNVSRGLINFVFYSVTLIAKLLYQHFIGHKHTKVKVGGS